VRKAISDGPEGDIARIGALDQRSQERLDIQLEAAMAWLCVAQDRDADAGVAGSYTLLKGWTKSYPETTGYIIPTFLAYARYSEREEFVEQERHLLYVACTRARERLRVTWSGQACEWLNVEP